MCIQQRASPTLLSHSVTPTSAACRLYTPITLCTTLTHTAVHTIFTHHTTYTHTHHLHISHTTLTPKPSSPITHHTHTARCSHPHTARLPLSTIPLVSHSTTLPSRRQSKPPKQLQRLSLQNLSFQLHPLH